MSEGINYLVIKRIKTIVRCGDCDNDGKIEFKISHGDFKSYTCTKCFGTKEYVEEKDIKITLIEALHELKLINKNGIQQ